MDEYITAEPTPFLAKRIPEWKEWRRQDDLEIAAAEALAQKEAEERAEARRASKFQCISNTPITFQYGSKLLTKKLSI